MTRFDGVSDVTRRVMQANRGKHTKPEMTVRRLLHAMGYRYRLHLRELPGCPDVVFSGRRKAIFVNGCFWHQHTCRAAHTPKTRSDFWKAKLDRNKARDEMNVVALERLGWDVMTVWECQLRDLEALRLSLTSFLVGTGIRES